MLELHVRFGSLARVQSVVTLRVRLRCSLGESAAALFPESGSASRDVWLLCAQDWGRGFAALCECGFAAL